MKFCFTFILNFVYFVHSQLPSPLSQSFDMILLNQKYVYLNNEENKIIISDPNTPSGDITITSTSIEKNKKLIDINDDNFIVFGLNNANLFTYEQYDYSGTLTKSGSFPFPFYDSTSYTIKMSTEEIFILSYIYNDKFYVYSISINSVPPVGGEKTVTLGPNINLNTIDCDSYDGENIFCTYSLLEIYSSNYIHIYNYYSFENIVDNLNQNQISHSEISSASVLKIDNNKFILCYSDIYVDPMIYCNSYIQNGNTVEEDGIVRIGQITGSKRIILDILDKNIPIIVRKYKHSIYFLFCSLKPSGSLEKVSDLFISSIDFNLVLQIYLIDSSIVKNKDILISDDYFILLTLQSGSASTITTHFEKNLLSTPCPDQELYDITDQISGLSISNNIINDFSKTENKKVSFYLESPNTLIINNKKNKGGLLNPAKIETRLTVLIDYNIDLKITNNYFIYFSDAIAHSYYITSNICYMKVINCYESCNTCNENIPGRTESHQCLTCKTDYHKLKVSTNVDGYFNCYKKTEQKVEGYYLENQGGELIYKSCQGSCLSCSSDSNCILCKDGYYFKEDSIHGNELNDICYKTAPSSYYLDVGSTTNYNGHIYTSVYKKCYDHCATCYGTGTDAENKCTSCKTGFTTYPYDSTKCTYNIASCTKFWKIDDSNNIECLTTCTDYIIHQGVNKNQCVKNCQTYINPYNKDKTSSPLLTYTCDTQKYCITLAFCQLKNLKYDSTSCKRPTQCFNMEDFTPGSTVVTPTSKPVTPSTSTDINVKRMKVIKYYDYENVQYQDVMSDFINNQTIKYQKDLEKEINQNKDQYSGGIDFISSSNYHDFTFTIYPLEVEDYVYNNVFKINNLCFANFTELLEKIDFNIEDKNTFILVGLIEHKNKNIPLNPINYFFYLYNREYNQPIYEIEIKDIVDGEQLSSLSINISYSLHNFNNSEIEEEYSNNLISSIQKLNLIDSEAIFFDTNSRLFNDICYVFTSEKNTDMTIEDRIKEYYIGISLCENNCTLSNVIDKEEDNIPRSLCECPLKIELNNDNDSYIFPPQDELNKKVENFNALKCVIDAFAPGKIYKNFIFWSFLVMIFIIFFVLINIICCGKDSIEGMLKIKMVPDIKNENISDSGGNLKDSDKNNEDNGKLSESPKLESIQDDNGSGSNYKNVSIYKKSNVSCPPKKGAKDLISNSEKEEYIIESKMDKKLFPSKNDNTVNTTINLNKKFDYDINNHDLSFDDIYDSINKDLISTGFHLKNKYIENNYILLARKKEKLMLKNAKLALLPPNKEDEIKYINTELYELEDYSPFRNTKPNLLKIYKNFFGNGDIAELHQTFYNKRRSRTLPAEYYSKKLYLGKESDLPSINDNISIGNNSYKFKHVDSINSNSSELVNNYLKKGNKKKKHLLKNQNVKSEERNLSSSKSSKESKISLTSSLTNDQLKNHFCFYYWSIFKKKEICIISLWNLEDNVAFFIRISTFFLVLSFNFVINCLSLLSKDIHNRYIYAVENDKINQIAYVLSKEISQCLICALICVVVKIILIKFIYGKVFKIPYEVKEEMSPYLERNLSRAESGEQCKKRNKFLAKYRKKSLIYISILLGVMFIFAYISICYMGTFINTREGILIRFIFSFVLSIAICAFICVIICLMFYFGKKHEIKCFKLIYRFLKIVY